MTPNLDFGLTYLITKVCGCCKLLFSIVHLYLICVWLSEDQITNIIKSHIQERLDYIFKFIIHFTLNIAHNWEDP